MASEPHSTLGTGIHGQRYNLNGRLDRVPKVGKGSPGPTPAFTSRLQKNCPDGFPEEQRQPDSQPPETCGSLLGFLYHFHQFYFALVTTKCICETKTAGANRDGRNGKKGVWGGMSSVCKACLCDGVHV